MQILVVIPAAGSSTRMGRDKLFIEVNGKPVIERTLDAFSEFAIRMSAKDIAVKAVVVTSTSNIAPITELVNKNHYDYVNSVIEGGASRTESVWKGIQELSNLPTPVQSDDVVFIHDGARCLVSQEVLDNCVDGIAKNDVCVVAVPAKNTIKRIVAVPSVDGVSNVFKRAEINNQDVIVEYTPSRDLLMEIQTPQCFRYDKLVTSYKNAIDNNVTGTDDTELAEQMGYKVTLVEGSYSNFKITTPEDIAMAEAMLNK